VPLDLLYDNFGSYKFSGGLSEMVSHELVVSPFGKGGYLIRPLITYLESEVRIFRDMSVYVIIIKTEYEYAQ